MSLMIGNMMKTLQTNLKFKKDIIVKCVIKLHFGVIWYMLIHAMLKQIFIILIAGQHYLKTEIQINIIVIKWIVKKKDGVSMKIGEMNFLLETDQNLFKKDIIVKCMISKQIGGI